MLKTSGSTEPLKRPREGVVGLGSDSRARRDASKLDESELDDGEVDGGEVDGDEFEVDEVGKKVQKRLSLKICLSPKRR